MSPYKENFTSLVKLRESKVVVADSKKLCAEEKGTVLVSGLINGVIREIIVKDVLYVPELSVNLLSVRKITEKGYVVKFDRDACQIINASDDTVAVAKLMNNIYELVQPVNTAFSCREDNSSIWHKRFGYLNRASMKLLRDKHAFGLEFNDPDDRPCEVCVKGKQARQRFFTNERRASKPLELVHSDVCGPIEEASIGGSRYFVLFIDDYTRRLSIYFLKNKSEVLDTFKTYKASKNIRVIESWHCGLTTDVSESFKKFLRTEGIQYQLTILYTPQQNGLAERSNRVVEKAHCLLADAGLPKKFWVEACSTATYLINRSPAKRLQGRTPHEIWSGDKPD